MAQSPDKQIIKRNIREFNPLKGTKTSVSPVKKVQYILPGNYGKHQLNLSFLIFLDTNTQSCEKSTIHFTGQL